MTSHHVSQVIAHLNTRNEDAEARTAEAEATHAAELAQLTADAKAKCSALRSRADGAFPIVVGRGRAVRERRKSL